MCTAMDYRSTRNYFGRNLDVDFSFREQVVITPRQYPFALKNGTAYRTSYAMIGMASVLGDYPLYYEAANEKGLAMAGLNFPKNAVYRDPVAGKDNIALFEVIPWILGQAGTVSEARVWLERLNLTNVRFSEQMPPTPLHFLISDRKESLVVEPLADGLHIYDNPYDVMTNNPPFAYHLWNIQMYRNLSPSNGESSFSDRYRLDSHAVGMGAVGLPGDASSASRFVKTAFHLANSVSDGSENGNVTQFFHVLDAVSMVKGSVLTDSGKHDITLYSCCINTDEGIYYYKTYENPRISAVSMRRADLDAAHLHVFDLAKGPDILFQN